VAVIVIVLGFLVPSIVGSYYSGVAVSAAILGVYALSVAYLAGELGLFSLGNTAFYGTAGYGLAITTTQLHWPLGLALVIALLAGSLLSLLIGAIVVRSRGVTFLMLTLAFGQLIYQLALLNGLQNVTGGYNGVEVALGGGLPGLPASAIADPTQFWKVAWVVLVVAVATVAFLKRSRFGRLLKAIESNEERVRFSGYDTYRPRLVAFVVSGVLASVAGVLSAMFITEVSASTLDFAAAGNALIAAIVGGVQTAIGPAIGGGVYSGFEGTLNSGANLQLWLGLLLIVAVVVARGGLVGTAVTAARRIKERIR
jgi:branched-chain amino acid transport system permease protein